MPLPLFLIPVAVGLTAQGLKHFFNEKLLVVVDGEGHKIPRYGGMPSAHTAFATSLMTTVGMADGFTNAGFAITVAFFIIIVDDALRMRMFLGRYGAALNILIAKLPESAQKEFPYIEKQLGHRPVEVLVGGVLGIVLTTILMLLLN